MKFQQTPVPVAAPIALRAWLAQQMRGIAEALFSPTVEALHMDSRAAPPERIADGDIVYADGVNWNPGSGVGIYARISGAWVKL